MGAVSKSVPGGGCLLSTLTSRTHPMPATQLLIWGPAASGLALTVGQWWTGCGWLDFAVLGRFEGSRGHAWNGGDGG